MLDSIKWAGAEIAVYTDESIALVFQRAVLLDKAVELDEPFGHTQFSGAII